MVAPLNSMVIVMFIEVHVFIVDKNIRQSNWRVKTDRIESFFDKSVTFNHSSSQARYFCVGAKVTVVDAGCKYQLQ